jgi:hypothetical protein
MELPEFVNHLGRVLEKWPDQAKWSISMIASYTTSEPEQTQLWVGYALDTELEFESQIDRLQGELVLQRLVEAVANDTLITRIVAGTSDVAVENKYEDLKGRLLKHTSQKEWARAYRNLSLFLGEFANKLTIESQVEAYGDCLRYGSKAKEQVGELVPWLKKGVHACAVEKDQESIEGALDFIEAYGDYFISNGNRQIVETLIGNLSDLIPKFELEGHLREVREELGI